MSCDIVRLFSSHQLCKATATGNMLARMLPYHESLYIYSTDVMHFVKLLRGIYKWTVHKKDVLGTLL